MDPIQNILSTLDGVKETKLDQWIAKCPAHSDRNPSLAIARGDDGRVLIKCWAGCSVDEIISSIGLKLSDLFEAKYHRSGRKRIYPDYRKILQLLRHQITVMLVVTLDIKEGKSVSDNDMDAFLKAYSQTEKVMEAANV